MNKQECNFCELLNLKIVDNFDYLCIKLMKSLLFAGYRSTIMRSFYPFSTHLQPTKDVLKKNLYKIDLINKSVNRQILSMAYSPGVGAICEQVRDNFPTIDVTTLRGRSVAIVTDGSVFDCKGENFLPVMDWLIAQIKYYSGYDAFPFVIQKDCDIN